jgi:hypothetical protein
MSERLSKPLEKVARVAQAAAQEAAQNTRFFLLNRLMANHLWAQVEMAMIKESKERKMTINDPKHLSYIVRLDLASAYFVEAMERNQGKPIDFRGNNDMLDSIWKIVGPDVIATLMNKKYIVTDFNASRLFGIAEESGWRR